MLLVAQDKTFDRHGKLAENLNEIFARLQAIWSLLEELCTKAYEFRSRTRDNSLFKPFFDHTSASTAMLIVQSTTTSGSEAYVAVTFLAKAKASGEALGLVARRLSGI
jgi:hypothetical protein